MSDNRRIARNTLMLYFRQILIMLVSLYTVRVVLNVLGAEDYGIYNVVAGVVTMFSFLSGAMATASQRYFSYDLGKGNTEHLKTTFSVTFQIYVLLALVIVILAESVGVWFVNHRLVIPTERLSAANWIFQAAIVSFLLTLITTPYMACIIAHENMNVYAYVSIVEVALKLGIVFLLRVLPYDKLVLYGILLAFVAFINTGIYRFYCRRCYEECRVRFVKDGVLSREIVSYSGWNLFGAAVGVAKNQLVNVALNLHFGIIVNAARSVAMQVNSAVTSFSSNFSVALNPQIIKMYAAGKKNEMLSFAFKTMRFVYLLLLWISIPLIFEMKTVLALWLKEPPMHTVLFTQLTLIDALVNSVSHTLGSAIQASGKIKAYQAVVGTLLLLNFPVALVLFKLGFAATSAFYAAITISVLALILRLGFMRKILSFKLTEPFVVRNFARILLCTAFVLLCLFCFSHFLRTGFFIANIFIEYAISALILLVFGLRREEFVFALAKIKERI